ncbi:MAG: LacI family DNA-binding transcriptional regulator [Verrucomicrobiota bacterium]|nr:LacI family DNA-binding transcriptional regulator [Verrucomicrobiota bacterium]
MARTTRDEVAALAGVSSATVSRAYNNPEMVGPVRLARIREAAMTLGYTPDLHASALRRRGTGTLLLLMPTGGSSHADDSRMYDFIFSDGVRGVLKALEGTMYSLRLVTVRSMGEIRQYLHPEVCDGVLVGNGLLAQWPSWLRESAVPVVVCSQTASLKAPFMCYLDELAGGRAAGEALRMAGCKAPAHITGKQTELATCRDRARGFLAAFPGQECPIIDGELGIRGGYESARLLLPAIRRGAIDSLFVVNDLTAVGVMQQLQEEKIMVPQQVAIVGYDNLPLVRTLPIPLATMDIAMDSLHQQAAELLFKRIGCRDLPPTRIPHVPTFIPGPSLVGVSV